MKKVLLACAVAAAVTLAGCSTPNPNLKRTYSGSPVTSTGVVTLPELGKVSEAEVGQSMVSTAKLTLIPAIQLHKDVVHTGENRGFSFTATIPAGVLYERARDAEGAFYLEDKKAEWKLLNGAKAEVEAGVYAPFDKTKPTEFYWRASDTYQPMNQPHPGIEYTSTKYEKWGKDAFKRELVYTGISQNTVSILYREFSDDIARPAFSQELKYDLSQGKTIGYKGARFEVIKATNLNIEYKVLKALD